MLSSRKHRSLNIIFTIVVIFFLALILLSQPPKDFPIKSFDFKITKGTSIEIIAEDLYSKNIISSPTIFKFAAFIFSINKGVMAGDYKFAGKENTFTVAHRMARGDQRQVKITVTIPEGTNVADMAYILLKNIPDFNAPLFVSLAKQYEGYLYPDTYYFYSNVKPNEVISIMRDNFNQKILTIDKDIKTFKKPIKDIIIMASIIEEEVNGENDRRMIAGILWKRLNEGMFLQVDAPFYYLTNKTGKVSSDDLKIDSQYNTYKYKGLPKGPISNPGIEAIKAAISPINSKYYFYLSGKDGKTYYASTYDGHLENITKYLR